MNIEYIFADPQGNGTVLVLSDVDPQKRALVARSLMAKIGKKAEQVGFLSEIKPSSAVLYMMGGEFCGNACASAAALIAETYSLDKINAKIKVAGQYAACSAYNISPDTYRGKVSMPLPNECFRQEFSLKNEKLNCFAAIFPGISHFVFESDDISRASAVEISEAVAKDTSFSSPAFGIIAFNRNNMAITPLVCVPETKTCVFEKSCASGTAAVGLYLAQSEKRSIDAEINQPGGSIRVFAEYDDSLSLVRDICISTTVILGGRETATISI